MDIIYVLALFISIAYFIQILMSLFVYKTNMYRVRTFKIIYKRHDYFKNAMYLILLFFLITLIAFAFSLYFLFLFTVPCIFYAFGFLKKYYQNMIMTDDSFLYNGVAALNISSVRDVFVEEGSNLEKKYRVPFKGIEKYKKGKYLVFKLASGHYVLVKNYDDEYFTIIQKYFKIKT